MNKWTESTTNPQTPIARRSMPSTTVLQMLDILSQSWDIELTHEDDFYVLILRKGGERLTFGAGSLPSVIAKAWQGQ